MELRYGSPNNQLLRQSSQLVVSKEKRFVVFHQRPKNLPNITMKDLQPLVSSLSPNFKRNPSSQTASRSQRRDHSNTRGQCTLEQRDIDPVSVLRTRRVRLGQFPVLVIDDETRYDNITTCEAVARKSSRDPNEKHVPGFESIERIGYRMGHRGRSGLESATDHESINHSVRTRQVADTPSVLSRSSGDSRRIFEDASLSREGRNDGTIFLRNHGHNRDVGWWGRCSFGFLGLACHRFFSTDR